VLLHRAVDGFERWRMLTIGLRGRFLVYPP